MFQKLHSLIKPRLPLTRPESVYFYTLHKCASSLFSDYVLKNVRHLRLVDYADRICNRRVVLKYEDMIANWEKFSSGLTRYLNFRETVLHQIYERSRPLKEEDLTSHRRSGRPGAYRDKLSASTIETLNITFAPV